MKRGFRRSADALKAPTYVEDKDSGELRRPHHVDLKSGMYRGRQILEEQDGRLRASSGRREDLRHQAGRNAGLFRCRPGALAAAVAAWIERPFQPQRGKRMFLINFPLMLVPFAVYNFFIVGGEVNPWENIVLRLDMMSGANFTLSMGEGLVVIALLLLFVEILKATRVGSSTIIDHILSTIVLIAYLAEFLMVAQASTSTFFILMVITLIDVIAGYSVSIRNASRDLTIER